jgi:uncharacterized protein YdhG (YjbR/CyaY superfamily)
MNRQTADARGVDEYIATFPPGVRTILRKIRTTVAATAPNALEKISYRMPAFAQDGILIYFAAFKHHIGVFPPVSGNPRLERTLTRYKGPKGNLKFPIDEPVPYHLIKRIVALRLRQNAAKAAVKRKKR